MVDYKKVVKAGVITGWIYALVNIILREILSWGGYTDFRSIIAFLLYSTAMIIISGIFIGVIIGFLFSFFYDRLPGSTTMTKSYVFFSIWFLVIFVISFVFHMTSDEFLRSIIIVIGPFLVNGFVLGYLWERV